MMSVSLSGQSFYTPSGRHGIRTHMTPYGIARFSKPAQPTLSGYLPFQWTAGESNPGTAAKRWSPGCKPSVFPLDQRPIIF
jgi:hypothetical protein